MIRDAEGYYMAYETFINCRGHYDIPYDDVIQKLLKLNNDEILIKLKLINDFKTQNCKRKY